MWWSLLIVLLQMLIKWLVSVLGLNPNEVTLAEALQHAKSRKFRQWARTQKVTLPNE